MTANSPLPPWAWIAYLALSGQIVAGQLGLATWAASSSGTNNSLSMADPNLTPETPMMAPTESAPKSGTASKSSQPSQTTQTKGEQTGAGKASVTPAPASAQSSLAAPANQPTNSATPLKATTPAPPGGSAPLTGTQNSPPSGSASVADIYPTVGRMEALVFGAPKAQLAIETRLADLEQVTFQQQYPTQTLFDRTQRLKATILGSLDETAMIDTFGVNLGIPTRSMANPPTAMSYLDEIASRPENEAEVDEQQINRFALQLINYLRSQVGLNSLIWDDIAAKMAREHVDGSARRNVISHANEAGDNPDVRYTKCGGSDAVTESIAFLKNDYSLKKMTRAQIARLIKILTDKEDDRDAILSPDATTMGFAAAYMTGVPSLLGCLETVTKHGAMEAVRDSISLGEKIEVKGRVDQPYHFEKLTIAWEGHNTGMAAAADESDEALPYFPPLDYVAYAARAEHDYEKAITALRAIGLVAAIAGGVFIPPVALAAPMIACSGALSEPKPLSDIPVHGGVKVDGSNFSAKLPMSNSGKEGVYYVTVWASSGRSGKAIPISRRAFIIDSSSSARDSANGTAASDHKQEATP
jgi:uncharacterized protein YkwD